MILKSRIKYLLTAVSLLVSCSSLDSNVNTTSPQTYHVKPDGKGESLTTRLTDINLATIGALAPKGRVQDTEYNRLPLVDQLIAHGKDSIPFLISKLNDETKVTGTTIAGVGWRKFLERGSNNDLTGEQVLRNYISRHGRGKIKKRWQKIWENTSR